MNPLGDNLLPLLVLAFGGAMSIGTFMALVRPPDAPSGRGDAAKRPAPPLVRSIVFIAVGALAALWALASLISG